MSAFGPPHTRFTAAEWWITFASVLNRHSLLSAYESALGLLPLVAWLGLPIVERHRHLAKIGGITRDAATAAISLGRYDKALEWLEQGRSIVWTQILHPLTLVDRLRDVNPNLADRILQISRLLDEGNEQNYLSNKIIGSDEEEGRRYRALTMEWESIIKQIRSISTFEDFLRPQSSQNFMKAAKDGPVVVLNIATTRCDALALVPGLEDIVHIPFPNITSEKVTRLRDELKDFLFESGIRSGGERAAVKFSEQTNEQTCKRVLKELWKHLVQPVLSSLAFSV
jgi:hypothetical protein